MTQECPTLAVAARSIYVIGVGPFGIDVAQRITDDLAGSSMLALQAEEPLDSAALPTANLYLLATWRPVPRLAAALGSCAALWRVPWLPIILDGPTLRVGPGVAPGSAGCLDCAERRLRQHSGTADVTAALRAHYLTRPDEGPTGYLSTMATLAAATGAELALELLSEPSTAAGRLFQFGTTSQRSSSSQVVGIHGCPRCGLGRPERDRSWRELSDELEDLLPAPAPSTALGPHLGNAPAQATFAETAMAL